MLNRKLRCPMIVLSLLLALALGACGGASSSSSRSASSQGSSVAASGGSSGSPSAASKDTQGVFLVVAGENFWGSLATQLAGAKAVVRSIIVNPATDPHAYTATASDSVLFAQSRLAIVNGIGYDRWASQSLAASPSASRVVLNVGDLLGLKEGDNPHQWYSPSSVSKVVDEIVADFRRLDPADAAYFDQQKQTIDTQALARYNLLGKEIRAKYAGVPVGYSESIFQPLGEELGLKLLTPPSFAKAIAEGSEVAAADKQTVASQAQNRQIKVWIYNSQNTTPDVQRVTSIVKAQHIPIATVSETLSPASDNFEQWQAAELQGLLSALHQATGR